MVGEVTNEAVYVEVLAWRWGPSARRFGELVRVLSGRIDGWGTLVGRSVGRK